MTRPIGQKSLATAANLANLLPTGTVLAFEFLVPSFPSNCDDHRQLYLTLSIIFGCSLACFLSSFTDSFVDNDGKLRYALATWTGLLVLNDDEGVCKDEEGQEVVMRRVLLRDVEEYKVKSIDFVHAFGSLVVFLVFALSSSEVQASLFPDVGAAANGRANFLVKLLPLGVGLLTSLLFVVFPTKRRGIGYGCVNPLLI